MHFEDRHEERYSPRESGLSGGEQQRARTCHDNNDNSFSNNTNNNSHSYKDLQLAASQQTAKLAAEITDVPPRGKCTSNPETPTAPDPADLPRCHLCCRSIRERYFMRVGDLSLHGDCLRCGACDCSLQADDKCYSRDGQLYCRNDYFRLFSEQHLQQQQQQQQCCGRCRYPLQPSDLVMRARNQRFHLACFTCRRCQRKFAPGDRFGMDDNGEVYCPAHLLAQPVERKLATAARPKGRPRKPKLKVGESAASSALPAADPEAARQTNLDYPPPMCPQLPSVSDDSFKPQLMTPMSVSMTGESTRDSTDSSVQLHQHADDPAAQDLLTCPQQPSSRQKRIRTSFKHNQLRAMKAYFQVNHNPDSKDLKQLAGKTGLSKRVLQVWFQNARAKYRRSLLKQQPTGIDDGFARLDDQHDAESKSAHDSMRMLGLGTPDDPSDISSTVSTATATTTVPGGADVEQRNTEQPGYLNLSDVNCLS